MAWQTWTLTAGADGADQVTIANLGATVLDWQVTDNFLVPDSYAIRPGKMITKHWEKQTRSILDGYRSEAEARQQDGYRSAILVPWNERIRDAKFAFDGCEHNLNREGKAPASVFRGLMTQQEFIPIQVETDYLHLQAQVPTCGDYDYKIQVDVHFRLLTQDISSSETAATMRTLSEQMAVSAIDNEASSSSVPSLSQHRLEVEIIATNRDNRDAPITLGWHPYLRCQGGAANTIRLSVPARIGVMIDDKGIPLPGLQAFENRACPVPLVHRSDLDFTYTHLVPKDEIAELRVNHQDGSQTALQMISAPWGIGQASFNVYSGQKLSLRRGQAIAVKPLLTMPDGFNRGECAELIRVRPGQQQQMQVALEYRSVGINN